MARTLRYKVTGIDELNADLGKVISKYPNYAYKYMAQAGSGFKRDVKKKTLAVTKSHTGNLAKGYRSTVSMDRTGSKDCRADISGGNGKAYHFHLVENGHRSFCGFGSNLRERGFVPGRYMMRDTISDWEKSDKVQKYAVRFLNKLLKEGNFSQ